MKKVININFHSRVIPIEETAYEILQQYVESLRRYFANEEGRDEIVSDIENRFAELFSESLKKGAVCITDADVNAIIVSMGRPEEFEEEERSGSASTANATTGAATGATTGSTSSGYVGSGSTTTNGGTSNDYQQQQSGTYAQDSAAPEEHRRLSRSSNDKILGGVAGGLANYLRIDPAIVRIIMVLLCFGKGAGVLLYLILWAVLPSRELPGNVRKRLYRNPEGRVIGGVAGGLAAYFHIEVWIPRVIFILPLILGTLSAIFNATWFDWDGPVFFTSGFGGMLFTTYIILWIVLPEAVTASEKLEMRGEKVDLESIKNTIKSDLGNFTKRAKDVGGEMKDSFQRTGEQFKQSAQSFAAEAAPVARRTTNGFGHAVGTLFKAFFLFIAAIIAFALIMVITVVIGPGIHGDGVITIRNYILDGFGQNTLAWAAFLLFFVTPVVALLVWLIRRITGRRSRNHYLGYTFGTLWVIGLICLIALFSTIAGNYRSRQHVEQDIILKHPAHNRLVVRTADEPAVYNDGDWWFNGNWGRDAPFHFLNDDSLLMNNVRVNIIKSQDSDYHVRLIRISHGNNSTIARQLATQIAFDVKQSDSVLTLPYGFPVSKNRKFRNQAVMVNLFIPVGQRIYLDNSVSDYDWFTINVNSHQFSWNDRHNRRTWDWRRDWDNIDEDWKNSSSWTSETEYIMTNDGLERADRGSSTDEHRKSKDRSKDNDDEDEGYKEKKNETPSGGGGYRYKSPDSKQNSAPNNTPKPNTDTVKTKATATLNNVPPAHLYLLNALYNL